MPGDLGAHDLACSRPCRRWGGCAGRRADEGPALGRCPAAARRGREAHQPALVPRPGLHTA